MKPANPKPQLTHRILGHAALVVFTGMSLSLPFLLPVSAEELTIAASVAFTEGPTVDHDGNVYFSDISSNRIMKLSPSGELSTYSADSNLANGMVVDAQNRLVVCHGEAYERHGMKRQGRSRVTRTDLRTGKVEVLADNYDGKPFRRPNDITIDGKGRLYFTDNRGPSVYRIDAPGKVARILTTPDVQRPNGIQVSPDDRILYVVEASPEKDGPRLIRAYDLSPDGSVSNMRVHYNFAPGRGADGISIDTAGNIYASAGMNHPENPNEAGREAGVYVISPEGKLIRFVPVPEDHVTNNTFGGADMKTLFITAGKTLYKMRTEVPGLPR